MGISVVAALSKLMKVTVKRDGEVYRQEYKVGKPLHPVKVVGNCEKKRLEQKSRFSTDDSIFSTIKFDFSVLETRLREIAFLNKGLRIVLHDETSDKKKRFIMKAGLLSLLSGLMKRKSHCTSRFIL